ncbi:MAG TPA: GTPase HflX [Bacillota bacterium]|nr:GTPase HflX [Bacillota bacterium]
MAEEKVLIIAVKKAVDDDHRFYSSLKEIESLSYTAGGEVIEVVTQNRESLHPALYMGTGKVDEVKMIIEREDVDLVIANDELSPGQMRNLEDRLKVPVIDRSQLILDIFAKRAKTREGQLQVELAQLEYMLPRLYGKGTILSRLGGGIGTRGPGETKLETDQRHIRQRIDDIKRRLQSIVKQRDQYRKRRRQKNVFQIAIVGYTNAGKSTIFNRLTESQTLEEDLLFATLDPLTRQIRLPSGFNMLITDTVGFLQQLPTTLIAAFRSTLEEVTEADFILHVVDAANPDHVQQQDTVSELLRDLKADQLPQLTVYNKMDLVTEQFIPTNHPYVKISAYEADDLHRLLVKIEEILKDTWDFYEININPDQGKLLHDLQQQTIVILESFEEQNNQYFIEGYIQNDHPMRHMIKEQGNIQ